MRQKDRMNENLEQQSVDETTSAPQTEEAADTKPESGKKAKDAPLTAQEEIVDFMRTAAIAIFFAILIRTFLFEPFNIPSGSMKPTLLIGDYLFVNKPAYGYSRFSFPFGLAPLNGRVWAEEPQRGDIVVFKLPSNNSVDYIKRIIGLPGETVQVRNGRLYINGEIVERELLGMQEDPDAYGRTAMHHYLETLPGGVVHEIYETTDGEQLDNTQLFTVPEGHYFMMGDNRDNSQDSRVEHIVGFVPFENIVGRADFLFFSTDGSAGIFEVWNWPWALRYERFFNDIDPVRLKTDEEALISPSDERAVEDAFSTEFETQKQ